jgi:aminopeptidase N
MTAQRGRKRDATTLVPTAKLRPSCRANSVTSMWFLLGAGVVWSGEAGMKRIAWAALPCLLACLASTAALAQYRASSTASLGRSYGRTSLMVGNLSLGRQALKRAHPSGSLLRQASTGQPVTRTPAEIEAALGYVADPQLTERTHAAMVALMANGKDAAARAGLEKDFADDRVLKEFAGYMADNGFSSRNVADATAAMLWSAWEIYAGKPVSQSQARAIDQQVRGVFLGLPPTTSAERQERTERLAYQIWLLAQSKMLLERTSDAAQREQARQAAAAFIRLQGLDAAKMRLTEQGFIVRR